MTAEEQQQEQHSTYKMCCQPLTELASKKPANV